jgi:TonB-linked SusC/RagA family outer membrane protein
LLILKIFRTLLSVIFTPYLIIHLAISFFFTCSIKFMKRLPLNVHWQRMLLLVLLMTAGNFLFAQSRRVTGTVSDESGGVTGATVLVKGANTATVTDISGNYSIMVPGNDAVLVISFISYETQEIAVGSQSVINATLVPSVDVLSEVIITGYTVDTRRQNTSAVSTVKTRDLAAIPTGNVEQQLQGRVAGLTVITNGQPGTESQVRIRGFGSFYGNTPLYIVDGVPTQNINFLSPDDIENTTVMKDASSASIYGARAAGGVVVISTKHGSKKPQKLKISYDALYGSTDPGKGIEVLNPQEQADWTWTALENAGIDPSHVQYGDGDSPVLPDYINVGGNAGVSADDIDLEAEKLKYNINAANGPIYQIVKANKEGTDWYDEITRPASFTRHSLGFSGAGDNYRYYVSLSLQDQQGIMINNSFKRQTIRSNTEFDLSKKIRIGQNFQATHRSVLGLTGGGGGANVAQDENDILFAFRMPTIIPVYDELGGYAGTAAKGFNNPANPVARRQSLDNNTGGDYSAFGNVYGEIDLLSGLTFRTSLGGNYGNYSGRGFNRVSYENSENNSSFGYNEFYGQFGSWVFTNTLQLKKTFGVHGIDVLLGQEAIKAGISKGINASGLDPFTTNPDYITLNTVSNRQVSSFNSTPYTYSSLFGRVSYSLDNKYYLTGVIRRDGSSRFGINDRYGIFPGFSAAWRVISDNGFLDDLKIRGGWGQMGNDQPVNPTNQYSLFASSLDNATYDITGGNTSVAEGFFQSQVGNPNARWEVSTTSNIGFDALAGKGKWDLVLEFWQKKTTDLLFNPANAQVLGGFAASPFQNVASMVNRGIDIQVVNKGKISSNAKYELTVIGSFLKNEITKITDKIDYFDVNPASNRLAATMIRNQLGYSISAFYGYQVVGLFQNDAEVTSAPDQDGAAPGRFRYADLDGYDDAGELTGLPDGKIDAADRTYIGSPVPDFTGGVNFKLTVGAFDVETYMYTSIGNEIFNLSKWFTNFYPSFPGAAIGAGVKDSWSTTNTDTDHPIFEAASNFSTNSQANSWYVEDGSFFRIQNVTLGYNFSNNWLSNMRISKARLYASMNNLATFTKYSGLDPGVGGAADTNFGIDVGNYPITRSMMVGLNVTF